MYSNTGSTNNVAVGFQALDNNTTGEYNIAIGEQAGSSIFTGKANIMIGNFGVGDESNTIRIGDSTSFNPPNRVFIAGIRGKITGSADALNVVIDSNGQLGTINSSRRFKEDIQDMGDASNGLLRLRPVTYRYKKPYADGSKPLDYGLIAEEVEEVYPDLVVKDKDGQVETVQYQKLTPMLLNELQKQAEAIRQLQVRLAAMEEELLASKATPAGQ